MGTKRQRNKLSAPDQLFARAQRELAKGNAKEALKDAKVCFRSDASPQHRQLLEQAYLGRAQQLHGKRLVDEASAVLDELAALVPTAIAGEPAAGAAAGAAGQRRRNQPAPGRRPVPAGPDGGRRGARRARRHAPCHSLLADTGRTGAPGIVGGGTWGGRGGRGTGERHSTQFAVERLETVGAGTVGVLSAWTVERCDQNWQRLDATRPAHRLLRRRCWQPRTSRRPRMCRPTLPRPCGGWSWACKPAP